MVWLLTEVVLASNPPRIPGTIFVFAFWLIFLGVGGYIGYRTRAPGWVTGGLPALIMSVWLLLSEWFDTKVVDWSTIRFQIVLVVLGMAGGWLGGRLRQRRLAKARSADETVGWEVGQMISLPNGEQQARSMKLTKGVAPGDDKYDH
jgi:hypothetical protein